MIEEVRTLIHVRSCSLKFFSDLSLKTFINKPTFVSEENFSKRVARPIIIRFDSNKYANLNLENKNFFKPEVVHEIIKRDRLLRELDEVEAISRIKQAFLFYSDLIMDFDLLLSISPDCYHIDILHKLFIRNNKKVIGLSASFLDGYSFLTSFGEMNIVKNKENKDFDNLSAYLSSSYVPEYMNLYPSDNLNTLKRYFKSILRYVIYNLWKRKSNHENYNVESSSYYGMPKFPSFASKNKSQKIIDNVDKSNLLYVPIQLCPEHNTDHWLPLPFVDYRQYLIDIISYLSSTNKFSCILMKDHPQLRGQRPINFDLSVLKKLKNVVFIDSRYPQSELLNKYKPTVFSTNSSASHEAMLRNLPVICHINSLASQTLSQHSNNFSSQVIDHPLYQGLIYYYNINIERSLYLKTLTNFHLRGYIFEPEYNKNTKLFSKQLNILSESIKEHLI